MFFPGSSPDSWALTNKESQRCLSGHAPMTLTPHIADEPASYLGRGDDVRRAGGPSTRETVAGSLPPIPQGLSQVCQRRSGEKGWPLRVGDQTLDGAVIRRESVPRDRRVQMVFEVETDVERHEQPTEW
jgi:hypothetical protein